MNIKDHIIFNIITIFTLKNIGYMKYLESKDWFIILFSSTITCFLPDIDHKYSFIGRRFKFLSNIIYNIFGHRNITHSIFIVLLLNYFIKNFLFKINIFSYYFYHGMIIGYINHIVVDMCTKRGVPLFWPIKTKFKIPINIINLYTFKKIILLLLIIIIVKLYF